ncbi:MAG TPA: protein kinase [Candidatus Polarisedimenticolia bacterium]|nr:protein kinase [Candidatus Polarisedimenticolia bacterium]
MTLSSGSRLGPYVIVGPVGAGGMGEVYRATDPRLSRDVAIKILPATFASDPERLRRFEREARAAGALNHPHIVSIHDIGVHEGTPYIVQELLEGETLRSALAAGPMPLRRAIDYGLQILKGLSAAHEKGIVHRDLKPENLFVTRGGHVKILDFGLVKLVPQAFGPGEMEEAPTRTLETHAGAIFGTVGYMSPEQARDRPADERSDLFAFGAVFYEMLAGRRAFRGESAADTVSAILKEEPPALSIADPELAPGLERIVRRCLEKDPARRVRSASDLVFDLEECAAASHAGQPSVTRRAAPRRRRAAWLAIAGVSLLAVIAVVANRAWNRPPAPASTARRISSVAVLPLRDLSPEPRQDYFADGLTEALTANLAGIGALKVISGTSAMQYKGSTKSLPEVARELGVDVVLEGTVARAGDRVRITTGLVNAGTDTQIWTKTFERDMTDILALQGEVAREVARQVEAKLTTAEQQRLSRSRKVDTKAYEAFLLGRYFLDQGTEESLKKAFEQFNAALAIDKDYAAPYAGIAEYYAVLPFYSALSPADVFPQARSAARKSLELNPDLPEAHASLAYIHAYYEWDWTAAEQEFRKALELRPSHAAVHFSYSRFLAAAGRIDDAIDEIRRAEELDPRSTLLRTNLALLSYFGGRYDQALGELLEIEKQNPEGSTVHWALGLVYEQKGMYPEAIAAIRKAVSISSSLNSDASLGHVYGVAGKPAEARAILAGLQEKSRKAYVPSYMIALIHAGLGETDEAFEWLEKAFQERSTVLAYLGVDPRLGSLRSDPRFGDLLRRTGRDALAHAAP